MPSGNGNEMLFIITEDGARRGETTAWLSRGDFNAWSLGWAIGSCPLEQIIAAAIVEHGISAVLDLLNSHPTPTPPPIFWQRDPDLKNKPYSNESPKTFGQAGCYVCAYTSLIASLGYPVTPLQVAQELNDRSAFDGPELARPAVLSQAYPKLGNFTRYDWTHRRANLEVIRKALAHGSTVVQFDFLPKKGVQPHFATAYAYQADPLGGQNDRLLVMCPWDGKYIDGAADVIRNTNRKRCAGGYFWPEWWSEAWMKNGDMTRVERILCGARIFSLEEQP